MITLLVAASGTAIALPVVLLLLRVRGVVDLPNHRSSHVKVVYRGGGLACFIGVLCGLAVAQQQGESVAWGGFVVVVAVGMVGLFDDVHTLAPIPRLVGQAAAGAAVGWLIWHQPLGVLAGFLVLMITVNIVNFMDGINGISGLTFAVWGVTAVVLGTLHHSPALVPIGAAAAGAALGFLPANIPTARLFLGDVGSYFFGGLIALGLLVGARDGVPLIALAAPLSVYVADTGYTLLRRAIRHAPLLTAHREHIYQRLVSEVGMSHTWVALVVAATSAFITVLWIAGTASIALVATIVMVITYLCSVHLLSRRRFFARLPPMLARR